MPRTAKIVHLRPRDTKQDTGYRWKDRDPMNEFLAAAIRNDGRSLTRLANDTGLCWGTLKAIVDGNRRRSLRTTQRMILRVLGLRMAVLGRDGQPVWREPRG